jgi:hypothetical protein
MQHRLGPLILWAIVDPLALVGAYARGRIQAAVMLFGSRAREALVFKQLQGQPRGWLRFHRRRFPGQSGSRHWKLIGAR